MEKNNIISMNEWRHEKVKKDMETRIPTDDDAYYEKNQTLAELCERQKQFLTPVKELSNPTNDEIYNRGVWDGIELAKQIINEFV